MIEFKPDHLHDDNLNYLSRIKVTERLFVNPSVTLIWPVSKIDLNYKPLEFPEGKSPAYSYIAFGEDGIGIQIEQPNGYRTFLANGLGYVFLQERASQTGNDDWVAERIIELQKLESIYKTN